MQDIKLAIRLREPKFQLPTSYGLSKAQIFVNAVAMARNRRIIFSLLACFFGAKRPGSEIPLTPKKN
jgi:hypothetical protein